MMSCRQRRLRNQPLQRSLAKRHGGSGEWGEALQKKIFLLKPGKTLLPDFSLFFL